MKIIKDKKGQFSLNGALILLLVMFLMVLAITVLGIGIQSMKLNAAAAELTRYIEIRGKVDTSVTAELERLETELGRSVDFTIDADYLSAAIHSVWRRFHGDADRAVFHWCRRSTEHSNYPPCC